MAKGVTKEDDEPSIEGMAKREPDRVEEKWVPLDGGIRPSRARSAEKYGAEWFFNIDNNNSTTKQQNKWIQATICAKEVQL